MIFDVGDRVKFKNSRGWEHHGTVSDLGWAIKHDWSKFRTIHVKWDQKSIIILDDYYDPEFFELVEKVQGRLL